MPHSSRALVCTPSSVAEVVRSAPDVIVAAANLAVGELARQTSTIPVVFTRVADPVGSGFVASIARPDLPNVERWYSALQARPAYRTHVMVPFEELRGRLAY